VKHFSGEEQLNSLLSNPATMSPSAISDSPTSHSPSRPRILVPEKVSAYGLALLNDLYKVDIRSSLTAEDLTSLMPSYSYHALSLAAWSQTLLCSKLRAIKPFVTSPVFSAKSA
jgi:hypothetical protein